MFWNSINRKNKVGDTKEEHIESVVAIHNNMNETTWKKVVEWERAASPQSLLSSEVTSTTAPKLSRFIGRPMDLSPKARFKSWLGHPLPFDRHDWTIERSDGSEGRYIIDYYHDDTKDGVALPNMDDSTAVKCIMVDVRPAVDGPGDFAKRIFYMPLARVLDKTDFKPLDFLPSAELKAQVGESVATWEMIIASQGNANPDKSGPKPLTEEEVKETCKQLSMIKTDCKSAQKEVDNSKSEEDSAKASMILSLCMAKIVCPLQHTAVLNVLKESTDDGKIDTALENMVTCIAGFDEKAGRAGVAGKKML